MSEINLLAVLIGTAIGAPIGWAIGLALFHIGGFVLNLIAYAIETAYDNWQDKRRKRSAR